MSGEKPSLHVLSVFKESVQGFVRTALMMAQYPAGVPWGDEDDRAFLVFGLAAVGEEHPAVMSHPTEVLDDEELRPRPAVVTDEYFVRETLAAAPQ